VRQAEVEQQQRVLSRAQRQFRRLAVLDPVHHETGLAQSVAGALADHRVVFGKQQFHVRFTGYPVALSASGLKESLRHL